MKWPYRASVLIIVSLAQEWLIGQVAVPSDLCQPCYLISLWLKVLGPLCAWIMGSVAELQAIWLEKVWIASQCTGMLSPCVLAVICGCVLCKFMGAFWLSFVAFTLFRSQFDIASHSSAHNMGRVILWWKGHDFFSEPEGATAALADKDCRHGYTLQAVQLTWLLLRYFYHSYQGGGAEVYLTFYDWFCQLKEPKWDFIMLPPTFVCCQ